MSARIDFPIGGLGQSFGYAAVEDQQHHAVGFGEDLRSRDVEIVQGQNARGAHQ